MKVSMKLLKKNLSNWIKNLKGATMQCILILIFVKTLNMSHFDHPLYSDNEGILEYEEDGKQPA